MWNLMIKKKSNGIVGSGLEIYNFCNSQMQRELSPGSTG